MFPAAAVMAGDEPDPIRFGFTGPEIFRLDNQISQLRVGDLDGDGLNDLVVVNNLRSRINVLYNQTGAPNRAAGREAQLKRDVNELPSDARFRVESIASEKRIAAMVVADLNSDDRPDLAFYGEPRELVVLFNEGAGKWSPPVRWPIEDGQLSPNSLTTGDVNGDGRADLVLLADTCVYCLEQTPAKTLGDPCKIPFRAKSKPSRRWMPMGRAQRLAAGQLGGPEPVPRPPPTPGRFGRAGTLFPLHPHPIVLGGPAGRRPDPGHHHCPKLRSGPSLGFCSPPG
jgi:hypothetical protein